MNLVTQCRRLYCEISQVTNKFPPLVKQASYTETLVRGQVGFLFLFLGKLGITLQVQPTLPFFLSCADNTVGAISCLSDSESVTPEQYLWKTPGLGMNILCRRTHIGRDVPTTTRIVENTLYRRTYRIKTYWLPRGLGGNTHWSGRTAYTPGQA